MKLLLLAAPNSIHTIKWATALAENNIDILLFGLNGLDTNAYDNYTNITVVTLEHNIIANKSTLHKLNYLKALPLLKRTIKDFNPDIIHAHYASSYGLLGALSGFHPFVISVWGSDIFSFPTKTFLHKAVVKFNLSKADKILSTSQTMAKETQRYTTKEIEVTPFGIDTEQFQPLTGKTLFLENDIVIGTVKALEKIYGIEYLIKAFKIIVDKHPDLPLKLLIVGGGSLNQDLKQLANTLHIGDKTVFTGKIPFIEVPNYHNMISVSVFISNNESFGVSVIEASSCGKPVVVSNVGGLPEVVENGVTGFLVPPRDPETTAKAIEKLILDDTLRAKMGIAGRERVTKLYNWKENVQQMLRVYRDLIR